MKILSILIGLLLILPIGFAQEPTPSGVVPEIISEPVSGGGSNDNIKEIAPDGLSYKICTTTQNDENCNDIAMSPGYKFTECALYTENGLIGSRGAEHPIDNPYTESECVGRLKGNKIDGVLNLCMNYPGSYWNIKYQGEIVDSGNCPIGKETCLITIDAKKVAREKDTTLKGCSEFFDSKNLELEPLCNSMGISPSGIVGVFEVKWGKDWIVFRDLCPDELLLPRWIRNFMERLFGIR